VRAVLPLSPWERVGVRAGGATEAARDFGARGRCDGIVTPQRPSYMGACPRQVRYTWVPDTGAMEH